MDPCSRQLLEAPATRPVPLDQLAEAIRAVEWGSTARGGYQQAQPSTGWGGGAGGSREGSVSAPPGPLTPLTALSTGWGKAGISPGAAWNSFIGQLARGCVHEWCGGVHAAASATSTAIASWFPPLTLMVHLAWRALEAASGEGDADRSGHHPRHPQSDANAVAGDRIGAGGAGCVVWIGRRCWPYAHALVRRCGPSPPISPLPAEHGPAPPPPAPRLVQFDRRLLAASIFVDPPDDAARLWAIDLALRAGSDDGDGESGGVALVIADGSRFDMAGSRRLQLAAEAGARAAESRGTGGPHLGGLGLILRPPWERKQLSAAATRWMVSPVSTVADNTSAVSVHPPRWNVELLRCKGVQPPPDGRREWMLELDRAGRVIRVLPPLADRPAAETRATG